MKKYVLETALGRMSFVWDDGAVRYLTLDDVEVIRAISAPIRNSDWGTCNEVTTKVDIDQTPEQWRVSHISQIQDGNAQRVINIDIADSVDAIKITARFSLCAKQEMLVNRAGFCVLHPLENVRGKPVKVIHSDGSLANCIFPNMISPGQPIIDIIGLTHLIDDVEVEYRFDGEIFEMEDQRNWSDASYKTYCRPLSSPTPQVIDSAGSIDQEINIMLTRNSAKPVLKSNSAKAVYVTRPELLMAMEPKWLSSSLPIVPDGFVMRAGTGCDWSDDNLQQMAAMADELQRPIDLELIVEKLDDDISHWASRFAKFGLMPDHVIVLPKPYLKSYQPDGQWPSPPDPEQAAEAAARAFPQSKIGVGMLTYFTEFNRCPPNQNSLGDYITYSTSAIIHAADTQSVFETLQALPDIFSSANSLAPGRPQRLGLVAIAMRTNPYGDGLQSSDADLKRFTTMTNIDCRHKGPVGAAFGIAAMMIAAKENVEAMCLGAPDGPFGLLTSDGLPTPLCRALQILNTMKKEKLQYTAVDSKTYKLADEIQSLTAYTDAADPYVIYNNGDSEEIIK